MPNPQLMPLLAALMLAKGRGGPDGRNQFPRPPGNVGGPGPDGIPRNLPITRPAMDTGPAMSNPVGPSPITREPPYARPQTTNVPGMNATSRASFAPPDRLRALAAMQLALNGRGGRSDGIMRPPMSQRPRQFPRRIEPPRPMY
jgi:hypothetical protein